LFAILLQVVLTLPVLRLGAEMRWADLSLRLSTHGRWTGSSNLVLVKCFGDLATVGSASLISRTADLKHVSLLVKLDVRVQASLQLLQRDGHSVGHVVWCRMQCRLFGVSIVLIKQSRNRKEARRALCNRLLGLVCLSIDADLVSVQVVWGGRAGLLVRRWELMLWSWVEVMSI